MHSSATFGAFYCKFIKIIGLKAAGNYSASIWINRSSLCLWEKPKTSFLWFRDFRTRPWAPTPTISLETPDTRTPKQTRTSLEHFEIESADNFSKNVWALLPIQLLMKRLILWFPPRQATGPPGLVQGWESVHWGVLGTPLFENKTNIQLLLRPFLTFTLFYFPNLYFLVFQLHFLFFLNIIPESFS